MRGNHVGRDVFARGIGSIPACAGEPITKQPLYPIDAVYPRVCGGTPTSRGFCLPGEGSIPACAGEPDGGFSRGPFSTVYPRVCGGTNLYECGECGELGLSPRVRGNPPPVMADQPADGSIPACAGEPHSTNARLGQARVYPRVCGGTITTPEVAVTSEGLSPRVRGNL